MRQHSAPSRVSRAAGACVAAAAIVVLAACTGGVSAPKPTHSTAPTTAPSAAPAAPAFVPDGTAAENLAIFAQVTATVWAGEQQVEGRAYIDALVAAGFDKAAMQVTQDQTTVGNPAESIQFSVRMGAECLVGQVGPSTGEPVTQVLPALAEGRCLVGNTRAIDW